MSHTIGTNAESTVTTESEAADPAGSSATTDGLIPTFSKRIERLSQIVHDLGGRMQAAAEHLHQGGPLPDYSLVVALGQCHRQLAALRSDLLRTAAGHGLKIRPSWKLAGVRELTEFLDELSQIVEHPGTSAHAPGFPTFASGVEAPADTSTREAEPAPQAEPPLSPRDVPLEAEPSALRAPTPVEADPTFASPISTDLSTAPSEPAEPHLEAQTSEVETAEPFPSDTPASVPAGEETATPHSVATLPESEPGPSSPVEEPTPVATFDPTRGAALLTLSKAVRLVIRDGSQLPELARYREAAEQLQQQVLTHREDLEPALVEALATGSHPIAQLANAVDAPEDLSDAQWADLHSTVVEEFGRPLAVALARHRLVIRPESDS